MITNLLFAASTALFAATPHIVADTLNAERYADSARVTIERAFVHGRPDDLVEARALVERGIARFPRDPLLRYYLGYALFREGVLREGDPATTAFRHAREVLEQSLALRELADTRALLASVIGSMIGSSVLRAIRFGRASLAEMDRALTAGPANPRVWMLKGAGALNQPTMFGGGADKAEAALRRAIALFASDRPGTSMPTWGLAETHGWLALALKAQGKSAEARTALAAGLALEPGHAFLLTRVKPVVEKPVS